MPLLPLKFGAGANLDVDGTTVRDGASLVLINAYEDRGEAKRTIPGNVEHCNLLNTIGGANRNVYTYDSPNFGVMVAVSAGRIFKITAADGSFTEVSGAELDETAIPTFTEDKTHIFIAANSDIWKFNPAETTVVGLGEVVTEEPEETTISVAIVPEFDEPDVVIAKLVSDGAAAIYYTTDGTTPSSSSNLYSPRQRIPITTTSTIKAIAYDGDGRASKVASRSFTLSIEGGVDPIMTTFTVGDVEHNTVVIADINVARGEVAEWCITEDTETPPELNDSAWSATPVGLVGEKYYSKSASAGTRTLRAYARDSHGNISTVIKTAVVNFLAAVTSPDAFEFTSTEGVNRSRYVESESITFPALTFDTTISVLGGEYAISTNNGLAWTNWRTATGTIHRDDAVKVRHMSSASNATSVTTTLTVGGVSGTFTSTTAESQIPRNVRQLVYQGGYILAIGQPAIGETVPGDVMYSDDVDNNYAAWEVYNNESNPDKVQAIIGAFDRIFNIGLKSMEVSVIDGVTPFAVNRNAYQHYGTPAPNSVAFDTESIFYITEISGSRKIVQLKNGAFPKIISIPIDIPLEKMGSVAGASGFTMGFRGQNFYVLDIPAANVTIDDQEYTGITLAYHLQKESWVIFGRYDEEQSVYMPYRGCSFTYVERWNTSFIGGRDGKLYRLTENDATDYTATPILMHRWRNNHSETWSNPRNVKLYPVGDRRLPPDQHQCGYYRVRQHELVYTDSSDAGEIFRAVIKSGWISHGRNVDKISEFYRYDVKRGGNDFVLNGIDEEVTALRR